ncbi:MAG: hypothetical protein ABEH38_07695 [Flavobacteriales bacterium]
MRTSLFLALPSLFLSVARGRMSSWLCLSLLLFVPIGSMAQWPAGKGNGYANLSFTYLRYHEVIDRASFQNGFEHHPIERYVSDHTLNAYLRVGVSDQFTVVTSVPFKFLATGDKLLEAPDDRYSSDTVEAGNLNTLGNLRIGGSYSLHSGTYNWSVKLMMGLKTASYQHATGLRSGYDAYYASPRILVGRGWEKWYFSASVGYRYKTNGYSDELVSSNEFGYKWDRGKGKKTWFTFTMGALVPVTKGRHEDRNSVHTGLYRDREGFVDPGLKIDHYLSKHWALTLSSIGAVWARHGGNELTYTGGISYEW